MGGMNLITGITADNDCFERVEIGKFHCELYESF